MSNDNLEILNKKFQRDCKVINMKYEYEGYSGEEQWAIISALTEEEIHKKYPEIIKRYEPFVLLSAEQGEVFYEFKRNEDKFRTRTHLDMTMSFGAILKK